MKSNKTPFISIAIPTYNGAQSYLRYTLESVLSQSFEDIEIIVSDNCSTDGTEALVKAFNDKRIHYFRHENNIGMSNNFNFCVKNARGLYFLLLCDDDLIDNDFVENCVNALNGATDVGTVITGTRIINENGVVLKEMPNTSSGVSFADFFINWFNNENVALYLCSTLYHTRGLQEINGFNSKTYTYHDVVATASLSAKYGRVDVHDVKASFRQHGQSHGKALIVDKWVEDSHYLVGIISDLCPERKEELKKKGSIYFAKKNYRKASKIRGLINRWYAYYKIYKKFEYNNLGLPNQMPILLDLKARKIKQAIKSMRA